MKSRALLLFPLFCGMIFYGCQRPVSQIYLGMGAKAGEITDTSVIIHVRLTEIPAQDSKGRVPGKAGKARLVYGTDSALKNPGTTDWKRVDKSGDFSVQFTIVGLKPCYR